MGTYHLLELLFSQSLDGFFFMMLDEPVQWDDAADKARLLDYVFSHQRMTMVNDAMLAQYGATLDNVVEEVLYVTDMDAAFAAAGPVRKAAYGSQKPDVASTVLVTPRLALPTQLVEIKFIARV